MQETFLKNVAGHVKGVSEEKNIPFEQIAVILPTRRSGLFFRKELSDLLDRPVWSPEVLSLGELIHQRGALKVEEEFLLITRLYTSYLQFLDADDFIGFYDWGEVILKDFDELDRSLVPPEGFFRALYEVREMEEWQPQEEESLEALEHYKQSWQQVPGEQKKQRIDFWKRLGDIYQHFRNQLQAEGIAYEGLAYRRFAEETSHQIAEAFDHWVFAGFNALSPSEHKIFNALQSKNKASFLWDRDDYYTNDRMQEAGMFLRQNLRLFSNDLQQQEQSFLEQSPRNVKVKGGPGPASVVSLVNEELREVAGYSSPDKIDTVVVLPDPSKAISLLHNISPEWDKVNFSMGMTFQQSLASSLPKILEDLYATFQKRDEQTMFHTPAFKRFVNHPVLSPLFPDREVFLDQVVKENLVYIPEKRVHEVFNLVGLVEGQSLFPHNSEVLGDWLKQLLRKGMELGENLDFMEKAFLEQVIDKALMLEQAVKDQMIPAPQPDRFFKLLQEVCRGVRVPFEGDPLEGLQIMGLLETMTLDFKNVIIADCNEEKLPGVKPQLSLFPHDLKKGYGIPAQKEQASITAYHFYRLLQRAENISFIYDNVTNGGEGEVSRYVKQLQWEWPEKNPEVRWNNYHYHQPPEFANKSAYKPTNEGIAKEKTSELVFEKGFSPTQLISFYLCPLQFYFNQVAGLEDPSEIIEDIEPGGFGTIFHKTVASLYEEKRGKILGKEDFEELSGKAEERLKEVFAEEQLPIEMEGAGKNLLAMDTLLILVKKTLEKEKNSPAFQVVATEKKLKGTLPNSRGDSDFKLRGFIDRLDYLPDEQAYRIVDFKTGMVESTALKMGSDKGITLKNREGFQMLFYSALVRDSYPGYLIKGAVFSLRNLASGHQYVRWEGETLWDDSSLEETRKYLGEMVENMVNCDGFIQTSDEKICEVCPYKNFCLK